MKIIVVLHGEQVNCYQIYENWSKSHIVQSQVPLLNNDCTKELTILATGQYCCQKLTSLLLKRLVSEACQSVMIVQIERDYM